jgi:outer membrane biosynthesis protein TonB
MNTIELIVSETGFVERVRLLSTPKRMADMMLLSGAKNWEFEPALKDGQSVRYRLELSWAATP